MSSTHKTLYYFCSLEQGLQVLRDGILPLQSWEQVALPHFGAGGQSKEATEDDYLQYMAEQYQQVPYHLQQAITFADFLSSNEEKKSLIKSKLTPSGDHQAFDTKAHQSVFGLTLYESPLVLDLWWAHDWQAMAIGFNMQAEQWQSQSNSPRLLQSIACVKAPRLQASPQMRFPGWLQWPSQRARFLGWRWLAPVRHIGPQAEIKLSRQAFSHIVLPESLPAAATEALRFRLIKDQRYRALSLLKVSADLDDFGLQLVTIDRSDL